MKKYSTGQEVHFGDYSPETEDKDKTFVEGDLLVIDGVDEFDLGVEYSVTRKSDKTKGFVFHEELQNEGEYLPEPKEEATPEETPAEEAPESDPPEATEQSDPEPEILQEEKPTKKKAAKKKTAKKRPAKAVSKEEEVSPETKASVEKGLEESAKGEVNDLGSFAEHADDPQDEVSDMIAREGLLVTAKTLSDRVGGTYFDLGRVLSQIYDAEEHKNYVDLESKKPYLGNKGFATYVEEVLKIHYRKAMDLIGIYRFFSGLGYSSADVIDIGWSKAREIARISSEDKDTVVKDLIEFAKDHTRDELHNEITEHYITEEQQEDGRRNKTTRYEKIVFSVPEDQATIVREGLRIAAEVTGSDSIDVQSFYVFQEFLLMNGGSVEGLEEKSETEEG